MTIVKLQHTVTHKTSTRQCDPSVVSHDFLIHAVPMSTQTGEGMQALMRLMTAAAQAEGLGPEEIVRRLELEGRSRRSFYDYWRGSRVPQAAGRRAIEKVFGWRTGAVDEILADPGAIFWDIKDVHKPDPETQPVERASELSTDELLMELTRRVGALQTEVTALRGGQAPEQPLYDLAAYSRGEGRNREHLEGDK
jgi:hypothetical protein